MATKLFFRNTAAVSHLGTDNTKLNGASLGWAAEELSLTAGASLVAVNANTVTGPTDGVEMQTGAEPREWISPPLSADVTISGAVTGNLWASETNMSANVAINFVVDVIRSTDNSIVQIVKSARVTEVAVTTRAVNNFTATPGAGVLVNRGDRIRVRVFGDDSSTMATGFAFSFGYNGGTGGADGDSFVTFTETFVFESAPAGSTIYFTDTVSDVATAAVDREAWTSRGAGVVNDVTNTAAGWTAPIQITDTAGGTVAEWYTKQLQAFTLGGACQFNIRALESNAAANASMKVEVAKTNSTGGDPVVLGVACLDAALGASLIGELSTSETAATAFVGVDDTAISDGERLRFRLFVDDTSLLVLVTGHTVTFFYNGTSGGASGDSFVTLPQTVTEFVASTPSPDVVMTPYMAA